MLQAKWHLTTDCLDGTVTVAGANGRSILAAFEAVRVAIVNDDIASSVLESIDMPNDSIADSIVPTDDFSAVQNTYNTSHDHKNTSDDTAILCVGDRIEVYWRHEDRFYPGTVDSASSDTD